MKGLNLGLTCANADPWDPNQCCWWNLKVYFNLENVKNALYILKPSWFVHFCWIWKIKALCRPQCIPLHCGAPQYWWAAVNFKLVWFSLFCNFFKWAEHHLKFSVKHFIYICFNNYLIFFGGALPVCPRKKIVL